MNFKRQTSNDYDRKTDDGEQSEVLKRRLLSAWNNMKFGLISPSTTTFSIEYPVWILGKCYNLNPDMEATLRLQPVQPNCLLPMKEFRRHFSSLFWFTYRRDFPKILDSDYTTDTGWGCMIRSAQMMFAIGLSYFLIGKDFRTTGRCHSRVQTHLYKSILRFFNDSPMEISPFSLHKLVKLSAAFGKQPGDWFGPSLVAHVLKKALEESHNPVMNSNQGVCVYVSQDCTIYKDDVTQLCQQCAGCSKKNCSDDNWRSLIILVPVRLGGESFNPIYQPCVKALLTLDSCIGIIGGRPKHSLYFVGFQEDTLIYLDPHFCQPAVDMTSEDFPFETFHCDSPRKLPMKKMDPSCTIGFYCANKEEFENFCVKATEMCHPPMQKTTYPIFIVAPGNCQKLTSSLDLLSSTSYTDNPNESDRFHFECRSRTTDDMYSLQEIAGESIMLADKPAEDYVVLGSFKENE
ncbi:cysteine protease ATG4D-like [Xenia sp. Carnegie-2017]|uniref:cysteine protease ATG4D-like n=1 Tax=Xenia sp. Carnegie-2017 TaxID=2897299 RepID=UPI001F038BEF|nr:cysteine protease ATG4D-like [Xenia sp. Carnegie-2017]